MVLFFSSILPVVIVLTLIIGLTPFMRETIPLAWPGLLLLTSISLMIAYVITFSATALALHDGIKNRKSPIRSVLS